MRRALALAIVSALLLVACDAIQKPKPDPKQCDPDHPCDEGSVCVPSKPGALLGRCVTECAKDADCPKGTACTGRYQKMGDVDRFCRTRTLALGADCTRPERGCKAGLHCFKERCVKGCARDRECSDSGQRCLPVMVDTMVDKDRKELFRACLPATRQQGQSCKLRGPFCGRNLVCHGDACVRTCAKDGDCGKGQICDGVLYTGPKRKERARAKVKPDVQYCRKAAKRNHPCHFNLDVGCARGLSCIKFRCRKIHHRRANQRCDLDRGHFCERPLVCYEGRCRKPCLEDKDCRSDDSAKAGEEQRNTSKHRRRRRRRRRKKHRKKRLRCQDRTLYKQSIRICL